MTPPSSDAALVARCLDGDPAAWRALVERYSRYVTAIAVRGFGLDDETAQDVHQDVFARTFQQLHRLRDPDALKPWLAQLARRLAVDAQRAAARSAPTGALDLGGADDERLARIELALDVRQALDRLPPATAEVLDRFFARDESYAVIGEALGLPPGTIASRISRGLARLREELAGATTAA